MSGMRMAVITGLAGLWLATPLAAQGLGDTAARERAKRDAKAKPEAKVFTNDDLDAGRPPGQKPDDSAPQPASGLSEEQPQGASPPPAEDRVSQEKPLLDAVTAAQQGVTSAQTRVQQLSEKLNPMSVSYIYGAGGSNDANEELRVREELRQAETQLQAAREALTAANRELQNSRQGRPSGPLQER